MSFQSLHFAIFFLIVLAVVRLSLWRKPNWKKSFLLAASYYFYMCWDWRFAGLIFAITAVNFFIGARIHNAKTIGDRKRWLATSLVSSLAILAYFKYTNFLIDSFIVFITSLGFEADINFLQIVLPVGISFYTFQSISYTLDIYRQRITPVNSFRDFALFVAFFPQLVAGPIVRASHFLPQLDDSHQSNKATDVESGTALIIRGLIKKVAVADVLALHFVDPAFSTPINYSPIFLLVAIYAYSFQIYMDFSGYTDIARGAARALGYDLQINFRRPYKSLSISEFWQRWHISMSSFFRDYLYFSVGGSKHGNVYFNLLITFAAIGLWHGAGWNFIIYGITHGALVGYERWRRTRRKKRGLPEPEYSGLSWVFRVFFIFNIVAFTRLLFRGGSVENAISYLAAMTNISQGYTPFSLIGVVILLIAISAHYLPDSWTKGSVVAFTKLPYYIQAILTVLTIYCLVAISSGEAPFVYFQF